MAKSSKEDLWQSIENDLCDGLIAAFANKSVAGWMRQLAPEHKINVYQPDQGKDIKIYTGSLFSALMKGRIPASLMAKVYFKKLAKVNYERSEIELLGIEPNEDYQKARIQFQFKRFNTSGEMYETAFSVYRIKNIEGKWCIYEMMIFDDKDSLSSIDLSQMWSPGKGDGA